MLTIRNKPIEISLRKTARNIFLALLGAELLIVLADIFLYQLKWLPWATLRTPLNITREDTFVNWFSSTQTFITGLILLAIFLLARRAKKKWSWGWAVLAGFFMFMSLDDGVGLHEKMGTTFHDISSATKLTSDLAEAFPSYYWQLVLGPLLIVATIFIAVFLWHQIGRTNYFYWIVVAVCLLVIAVMLDFAEGMDVGIFSIRAVKHNAKLIEEFIEMLGNTVFLVTFLQIMAMKNKKISLHFSDK